MSMLSVSSVAAVAVAVASVYRDPDASSEVVTQALLNMPAQIVELRDPGGRDVISLSGWAKIRLSDYEGWIQVSKLAQAVMVRDFQVRILSLRTAIYADADSNVIIGYAYATTLLPADGKSGDRVQAQLPGGAYGWLDAAAVELRPARGPLPESGPEGAISLAQQLLGTPYLWGGVTIEGIDCSGLTQVCCRAAGVTIPRDADQQYEGIPYIVERADLHPGDLIYFASGGKITHTALMIDRRRYIHAKGGPENRVIRTGLEPGDISFDRRLAGCYAGARRPFARKAARVLV
jgi:gamma-D-glutamyl-L-lysine dipeptidyl-peptidase